MNQDSTIQNEMYNAGLGSPNITDDGEIHRFHVEGDKSGTLNGWYVSYQDGGAFGSWKTGYQSTWSDCSKSLNAKQQRNIKAKIREAKHKRKLELQQQYLKAAENARAMWNQSAEALFHPYLKNKRVLPFGIRQRNNLLILPLYDTDHKIWSYQSIDEKGKKRFMKGGKVSGHFYQIGKITDQVCIAEGFATAATLNQVLNKPVIAAFNAGNLKHVAETIRSKFPDRDIIILADNDKWTDGNPGVRKATAAAKIIEAHIAIPHFKDTSNKLTDFNDLHCSEGLKIVKHQIESVLNKIQEETDCHQAATSRRFDLRVRLSQNDSGNGIFKLEKERRRLYARGNDPGKQYRQGEHTNNGSE